MRKKAWGDVEVVYSRSSYNINNWLEMIRMKAKQFFKIGFYPIRLHE